MRHKPKTRRHIQATLRKFYTTYRGLTGETVMILYRVNTGKDYRPQHIGHDAAGAFLTTNAAVANMRDIRGHGRNTSRCKRAERQKWNDLARVVEALPPVETRIPFAIDYGMGRSFSL